MPDFPVSTTFTAHDQLTQFFTKGEAAAGKFETMVKGAFNRSGREASLFSKIVGGVTLGNLAARGISAAGRGIKDLVVDSKSAAKDLMSLKTAYGSVFEGKADDQLKFAFEQANRLGLAQETTARSYMQLAASAKGTKLEGATVKEAFLGVAEASTALKLSQEQSEGAILAVTQMISKGKISAEELRRQMGERIPGAFNIAARAMGVTTQRLDKMISTGRITAEKFIPRFAAQLRKEFGPAAIKAAQDFAAIEQRFENLKLTMRQGIGSTILPILAKVYERASPIVMKMTEWVNANRDLISTKIIEFLDNTVAGVEKAIPKVREFVGFIQKLTPLIKDIGPGFVAALIAYKAMEIAFKGAVFIMGIFKTINAIIFAYQAYVGGAATATEALNFVMAANPVGLVCVAVATLAGLFAILANRVGGVGPAFGVLWNWVKTLGSGILSSLLWPIEKLFDLLGNLPGQSGEVYRSMAKGLKDFRAESSKWAGGNGGMFEFGVVHDKAVGAKEVQDAQLALLQAKTEGEKKQATLDLKAAQLKAATAMRTPDDPEFWKLFESGYNPKTASPEPSLQKYSSAGSVKNTQNKPAISAPLALKYPEISNIASLIPSSVTANIALQPYQNKKPMEQKPSSLARPAPVVDSRKIEIITTDQNKKPIAQNIQPSSLARPAPVVDARKFEIVSPTIQNVSNQRAQATGQKIVIMPIQIPSPAPARAVQPKSSFGEFRRQESLTSGRNDRSSPREAPNKAEVNRQNNLSKWIGRLFIGGAPEGSKFEQESFGPAELHVELMGANN